MSSTYICQQMDLQRALATWPACMFHTTLLTIASVNCSTVLLPLALYGLNRDVAGG